MQKERNNQKGIAMIIVVCIMAVMMALSLALLAASALLIGNAQSASDKEQARIFTLSVNRELEEALTISEEEASEKGGTGLWSWVNEKLKNDQWPEYGGDWDQGEQDGSILYLTMDHAEAIGEGKVIKSCEIVMYWESLGENQLLKKLPQGGYETVTEEDLELTIRVTCATGKNKYTLSSVFGCRKTQDDEDYYWYVSGRE